MAADTVSTERAQPLLPQRTKALGASRALLSALIQWLRDFMRQPVAAGLLALLITILTMLALRHIETFADLELMAYDKLVVLRSHGPPVATRVTQIEISEDDLERYHWPLNDGILAQIIDRLRAHRALAIGIDIFRPTPIGPGTDALSKAINDTPQLIWADRFREGAWEGIPAPAAAIATNRVGFADMVLDGRGEARRGLLYLNDATHWEASFSLQLALLYLAANGITPVADQDQSIKLGQVSLPPLDESLGGYAEFDAHGYQIMREFRRADHAADIRAARPARRPRSRRRD